MNTNGIEKQFKVGLHNNLVSFWIRKPQDYELGDYFTYRENNTRIIRNKAHVVLHDIKIPCLQIVHSNFQLKIHSLIT
jgi:hypothetical protein